MAVNVLTSRRFNLRNYGITYPKCHYIFELISIPVFDCFIFTGGKEVMSF